MIMVLIAPRCDSIKKAAGDGLRRELQWFA
jgi:hypothetical protein